MTDADVSDKPILFSGPMVRAILEGRKTQTRRIIKPQVSWISGFGEDADYSSPAWNNGVFTRRSLRRAFCDDSFQGVNDGPITSFKSPYGSVGGRLWVRETWADVNSESGPALIYRADGCMHFCTDDAYPVEYERYPNCGFTMWVTDLLTRDQHKEPGYKWRPSIFMPKWACRLFLTVTDIRVERLQDISEEDCYSEGIGERGKGVTSDDGSIHCSSPLGTFIDLWGSINGKKEDCAWADNPWVWVVEFKRDD